MQNDQIPNYTVHTQYTSIRSTSQKCKQIWEITPTDRTALFNLKQVKFQQQLKIKQTLNILV